MCKKMQMVYPDFKVSINLSYVQILKSAILEDIFNILAKYGLKPESFVVEITESGYLENSLSVRRVWDSLKRIGVLIALDDFGTGYSNLSSISNFTPDYVKLDRGFTVKALNNSYENTLMKHIIDLVHSVELKIVVEGVETEDELHRLNNMEPDYIQGYFYSRPLPESDFEKLLCSKQLGSMSMRQILFDSISDGIWNPASLDSLIFNSFVGPAAIFEYSNGKIEYSRSPILRIFRKK